MIVPRCCRGIRDEQVDLHGTRCRPISVRMYGAIRYRDSIICRRLGVGLYGCSCRSVIGRH